MGGRGLKRSGAGKDSIRKKKKPAENLHFQQALIMFRLLSPLTAERSKFLGKGVRGNDPFFKKGLPPVSSASDPSRALCATRLERKRPVLSALKQQGFGFIRKVFEMLDAVFYAPAEEGGIVIGDQIYQRDESYAADNCNFISEL